MQLTIMENLLKENLKRYVDRDYYTFEFLNISPQQDLDQAEEEKIPANRMGNNEIANIADPLRRETFLKFLYSLVKVWILIDIFIISMIFIIFKVSKL